MRIAQIIGPYRADTPSGIQDNIDVAKTCAKEYWVRGYAVICPHTNSAFFDGLCQDAAFLDGYLEIISRLDPTKDILVTLPGWGQSSGSKKEVELGKSLGFTIHHITNHT